MVFFQGEDLNANAKTLATEMMGKSDKVVSGCTDHHLILVNSKASKNLDRVQIENIGNKVS